MLIEFRVKNYRSFNEEQVFSMVATKDRTLSDNVATVAEWHLLRTAALYGPNASGKSNLVRAIRTMSRLVRMSADQDNRARSSLASFALHQQTLNSPSTFEATFLLKGVRYQYGFSATKERIWSEWLLAYPKAKGRQLVSREFDPEKKKTKWTFSASLKGEKEKLRSMVRDDALFLSVAAKWNHEQLLPVYDFLSWSLRTILIDESTHKVIGRMLESESTQEDRDLLSQAILEAMKEADPSLSEMSISPVPAEETEVSENLPSDKREEFLQRLEKAPRFKVELTHKNEETGQTATLPFDDESDGTRRMLELLGPWLDTLKHGYVVFVDELDRSLHPLLVRALVKLIQSPITNRQCAQLIFTTHDTTLLDRRLLRRDQIWFTEKDKTGATHLYPMSDYKAAGARKGEPFQKRYLEGRYGAIPIIKAFDLGEPKVSQEQ